MGWVTAADGLRLSMPKETSERPAPHLLGELYHTHYEKLAHYFAVRIGNPVEAQDLASEVFLRALQAFDRFQWRNVPIEAWLFKIAHNLVVDHRRKLKGRRTLPLEVEEAALEAPSPIEEQVEKQEELQELQRGIHRLTQAQQQVLALRFGAEMTSEEAGRAMGKKAGAIREFQSSAIKALRKSMGHLTKPTMGEGVREQ